ncbi:MAG: hypothetical protein ACRD0K_21605 [Egibacteraceae bacterium]
MLKTEPVRVEAGEHADAADLAERAAALREELLQLDVARVDLAMAGPAPAGTRAGEALAAGVLLVDLAASTGLLDAVVVDAVRSWVSRPGQRSVRLELDGDVLEVTGVSWREQRRLIQTWIDRHTAPAGSDAGQ